MPDREKVKKGLDICTSKEPCNGCPYLKERNCSLAMVDDALALLQEQEEQKRKWLQTIADNQLAHAPKDSHEFMSLNEHLENEYKKGVWDGLQIAWNIISEGR